MTLHIITDGSSDLPESIRDAWGIRVVPLGVRFGEAEFDSTMASSEFYARMRESESLPQTSSPAPHAFMDAFRDVPAGEPILVVALSSQVSSTYRHAVLAKEMFEEERPDAGRIEVIDSKTASAGLGGIVYKAAKMAKDGVGARDIASAVKRLAAETRTHFVLDTLENVIKGGRLDRVRGAVASMLNIKLLMHASEQGAIEVLEKARGTSNAVKKLIDRIEDAKHEVSGKLLAVAHSNCEERAKALVRDILARYDFGEVIVSDMGPVIGTYAGEGGLLISY
ncbi:DegV family protein [Paenibacillus antri]|uniref:DegV family protein n=1 Tax=Paenibacillus antri TaxID=2582848 RepID=A0A5R9G1G6_9BACL|nr:DegV family protein [Paenibacillus antri]TLS50182.1 DegV family protein [Paenibacillus antri]